MLDRSKLDHHDIRQRIGDGVFAPATKLNRPTNHIGAHALVGHKTMQIRARQKQQSGLMDVDDLASHADDLNRPAPDQVDMTA